MKIGPRHHAPIARNWISLGLTVRQARELTECLRRSMLVDRRDPPRPARRMGRSESQIYDTGINCSRDR